MAEKIVYPLIPEITWWSLRAQFKKSVPSSIDIAYLVSVIKLGV